MSPQEDEPTVLGPQGDDAASRAPRRDGPAPRAGRLRRHNPAALSPPTGFSHAVSVAASGSRLVFLAGQTALDSAGTVVGGTLVEQFETALTNLLAALADAGGGPGDLVRVTVYATDVADYRENAPEIGRIWRRLAGREYPAMAVIGAVRLWDEQALVELDGIAVL
ncbi:RidA family protein [Streptomyces sp. NPDC091272]|uniref:RidA family protein n=1 Tax=Streptomyces sp. NPDC091272 TaxID=3365981 RepID=UPI00382C689C